MSPTTRDLAREAGVSLATVDRVLNGRPGVRQATLDAVMAAVDRIGFVRNQSAANLARRRIYRFQFLLPRSGHEFLASVISRITETHAALQADSVQIGYRQVLENDPHQISAALSVIEHDEVDGIAIMAPESPQVRDAMLRAKNRGIHVVQFVSGQQDVRPFDFVGVDNHAAGATAGRLIGRFTRDRSGSVLVISETMTALDSVERRLGFDAVLTADYPNLVALPSLETHGDPSRTRHVIRNAYASQNNIVAVYVLSSEAGPALAAIAEFSDPTVQVIIAHERTQITERQLWDGTLDAVIAQDPGHLVRSAVRVLRARSDGRTPLASQEKIRIEILLKENLGLEACPFGLVPRIAPAEDQR
ncbi:MAG: substrate-binding domain-containing protein [Alphaproteobacteria bacterium]|nr:substrate-binding domain-containing protein [Alphaproteobacteria bacterium]